MTTCLLCNTNDHAVTLYPSTVREEDLNATVFSARRMPDRVHGHILRCTRCGLVYARELLDQATLNRLYRDSAHTYGDMEPFIARTYMRYVRRAMRLLQPGPRTSIDIGCGNGFLLQSMLQLGFDAYGIEPGADAIAKADASVRGRITQGMATEETLPPNRFDLVTCFQTLDHIPDPLSLVRTCARTLKPGGVALFINHDIASWTARLLGERCPMIDIEHTFLHTKRTMRMLFDRAGFSNISVFSVRNDYPLHYWLHLAPLPASFKRRLIGWSRRTRIGNIVLPLYAGNLGLIAQRR